MIVRRHLAGGDARPSRPAGGTQRPDESRPAGDVAEQSAESAAPMETAETDATESSGGGEEATLASSKSAAAAEAVFHAASAASLSAQIWRTPSRWPTPRARRRPKVARCSAGPHAWRATPRSSGRRRKRLRLCYKLTSRYGASMTAKHASHAVTKKKQ